MQATPEQKEAIERLHEAVQKAVEEIDGANFPGALVMDWVLVVATDKLADEPEPLIHLYHQADQPRYRGSGLLAEGMEFFRNAAEPWR